MENQQQHVSAHQQLSEINTAYLSMMPVLVNGLKESLANGNVDIKMISTITGFNDRFKENVNRLKGV